MFTNHHSPSIIETSSIASISLDVPSPCPLSTGVLVALVVVGVTLLASLIGHALTTVYIVVLKRRSDTSKRCRIKELLL